MKVLYVVQPLTGDRIDDNHIRVEHHHAEGLTYTDCLIDGVVREVRSTSRVDRRHPITKSPTIIVHLKPLPSSDTRVHCRDLDTARILAKVSKSNSWPTHTEYVFWNDQLTTLRIHRLITRKQRTLVRTGYVITTNGVPFTTAKGRRYLELAHAGT